MEYDVFISHASEDKEIFVEPLAEGIAKSGKYEFVMSCVAYDSRNTILIECMSQAGINDFTKD